MQRFPESRKNVLGTYIPTAHKTSEYAVPRNTIETKGRKKLDVSKQNKDKLALKNDSCIPLNVLRLLLNSRLLGVLFLSFSPWIVIAKAESQLPLEVNCVFPTWFFINSVYRIYCLLLVAHFQKHKTIIEELQIFTVENSRKRQNRNGNIQELLLESRHHFIELKETLQIFDSLIC